MAEGNPNIPIQAQPMMWGFEPIRSNEGNPCVMVSLAHPMGLTKLLFAADDFKRFAVEAIEATKKAEKLPPRLEIASDLPRFPENGQGPR